MYLKKTNFNIFSKFDYLSIITISLINSIYFFFSYDNPWTLDDFGLIFPVKLFNLINNNILTFQTFLFSTDSTSYMSSVRYLPLYDFVNQILPSNSVLFHLAVVVMYSLCGILVFFICKKIIKSNLYSLIAATLFSLNYGISIKMLSWNLFYNHLLSCVFGFLSILIFINLVNNKKNINYKVLYIIFATFAFLTSEVGLVFPILTFVIYLLFFKENYLIKSLLISLSPLIIFVLLVFLNTGKILPLLFDRLEAGPNEIQKVLDKDNKNELYFNRSTYASRNFENYLIRSFDNLLNSTNLSTLEKVAKFYDKNNKIKNLFKEYYKIFYFLITILLLFLLYFIIKQKYSDEERINLIKLSILYCICFGLFTIIFFRKDLNLALSFCSSILISYILMMLDKKKLKFLYYAIIVSFIFPSILYFSIKFEYTMTDLGPKTSSKEKMEYLLKEVRSGTYNNKYSSSKDYKYLYYYFNFEKNKDLLMRNFQNLNYPDFTIQFSKFKLN